MNEHICTIHFSNESLKDVFRFKKQLLSDISVVLDKVLNQFFQGNDKHISMKVVFQRCDDE